MFGQPRSGGENLVFMNNRGGALGCAGVWSICGGNGQSFADADVSSRISKGHSLLQNDLSIFRNFSSSSSCITLLSFKLEIEPVTVHM